MPTLNEQVDANDDDAHEKSDDTGFAADAGSCKVGGFAVYNSGYRFQSIALLGTDTIDSATMQVVNSGNDDLDCTFSMEDEDDANDFNAEADVNDRTRTTNNVSWDDQNVGAENWSTSPDNALAVQEVIDRGGWATGQALVALLDGDDTDAWFGYSHDGDNAKAAKLDIDYTAAAAGTEGPLVGGKLVRHSILQGTLVR